MRIEEAKIRDFILKLAEEKGMLKYSDYGTEDRRVWKYLFSEVERDGYIKCVKYTSFILPEITGKGILFLDGGGYSGLSNSERKEKSNEIIARLIEEFGKICLSSMIGGK